MGGNGMACSASRGAGLDCVCTRGWQEGGGVVVD